MLLRQFSITVVFVCLVTPRGPGLRRRDLFVEGAELLADFKKSLFKERSSTGIRLIADDGTVVHARTMEFAIDIHSDVMMFPRGYARTGTTPDGKEGLKWKAKYASVGLNGVGQPVLFDGLNEKGLAAGTFYLSTSAGYMP